MNYESELQEVFWEHLKQQYGIEDDTALYHYLVLRFYVWRGKKTNPREDRTMEMIGFLLDELNLPDQQGFEYRGEWIQKRLDFQNSLSNIVENWMFQQTIRSVTDANGNHMPMESYISHQWALIEKYANNKAKRHKYPIIRKWYWKKHALERLNMMYQATPGHARKIEGVTYASEHDEWRRTMEEQCESWIHANEFQRNDVQTITESDLEDYLYTRLDLIEEGLRLIDRQYIISDGRIDLLAKDREGRLVIIELKVCEDKELIWQCMYYPTQIQKLFGVSDVRMITLAPSYSNSLLMPLRQLGYVEIMTFTPKVRLGRIEELVIELGEMKEAG